MALQGVKKNRNATGKWLEKMKLSVLRKLQAASKVCFMGQAQNAQFLKGEIEKLRETIKKQTVTVRELAMKSIKSLKLSESSESAGTGYKMGRFDTKVQKISSHFDKVATQLDEVGQNLQSRLTLLTNTLSTVQTGMSNKAAVAGAAAPMKRGPGRPPKTGKAPAASPDGALSSIHKHLETV